MSRGRSGWIKLRTQNDCRLHPALWALTTGVQQSGRFLTWNANLELPTLPEPPLDNAALARRQRDLQPHKQLEVGLLLEQVAAYHRVIVSHLRSGEREEAGELWR